MTFLAVQETHLDEQNKDRLNILFQNHMFIEASLDPKTPNAMGVAFIMNKQTTR